MLALHSQVLCDPSGKCWRISRFCIINQALLFFIMAIVLAFVYILVNANVIVAVDGIVEGCGKLQGIQGLPDRFIGKAAC
jgi:hypothetical protein